MFELTLLDHLRMTFGQIVYRHRAHAQIAHSRARWNRGLRAAEALLMAGVAFAAVGAAFGRGPAYEIASAALAILALAALLIHLTFDFDRSARAHSSCAARLWHLREQYRALMSDLSDGATDVETVRRRRDQLMTELRGVYDSAPPEDLPAYQSAAQAVLTTDEHTFTDEEIDRFLPKSLQTAGKPGQPAPRTDIPQTSRS